MHRYALFGIRFGGWIESFSSLSINRSVIVLNRIIIASHVYMFAFYHSSNLLSCFSSVLRFAMITVSTLSGVNSQSLVCILCLSAVLCAMCVLYIYLYMYSVRMQTFTILFGWQVCNVCLGLSARLKRFSSWWYIPLLVSCTVWGAYLCILYVMIVGIVFIRVLLWCNGRLK